MEATMHVIYQDKQIRSSSPSTSSCPSEQKQLRPTPVMAANQTLERQRVRDMANDYSKCASLVENALALGNSSHTQTHTPTPTYRHRLGKFCNGHTQNP